tara:strand:- start:1506 stop:2291 length:786 start_codon:yes stop_codon:yes gene_type:complete
MPGTTNISAGPTPLNVIDARDTGPLASLRHDVVKNASRLLRKGGFASTVATILTGDGRTVNKTSDNANGTRICTVAVTPDHVDIQTRVPVPTLTFPRFHQHDAALTVKDLIIGQARVDLAIQKGKFGEFRNLPKAIAKRYTALGIEAIEGNLATVKFVDSRWDDLIAALASKIQATGTQVIEDKTVTEGSNRGGDTSKSDTEDTEEASASSAVSLDFGTAEALAGVRAYFGASTNSALSVILADLVKAQMNTGKVPLKIAN